MATESCRTSNTRIELDRQSAAQDSHDNVIVGYGHAISLKALGFMYNRRRGASNGNRHTQQCRMIPHALTAADATGQKYRQHNGDRQCNGVDSAML